MATVGVVMLFVLGSHTTLLCTKRPGAAAAACCVCLQLLGLLLPKYVPDESLLRSPSWVGVLQHADALVPMLQQHVMEPLLHGEGERGWGMQTGLRAWCAVLVGTPGWLSAIFAPWDDGPAEV